MMEDVPCYFVCPISLQMMRDPVTLPTGITYERECIERWLASGGGGRCPVTKQAVAAGCEPTPNHTLRRLIQAWCAAHHRQEADVSPDKIDVASLLAQIQLDGDLMAEAVRELRDVAADSHRNRELIAAVPGAVDTLVSAFVIVTATSKDEAAGGVRVEEALLEILAWLISSEAAEAQVGVVVETETGQLVDALVCALQRSTASSRSREHAARLLADVTAVMPPNRLVALPEQLFHAIVHLLRHGDDLMLTRAATRAALRVLVGATSWGRNRVKAVDAGAVPLLLDMLLDLDSPPRRLCELALAALDRLCGCADGRADLVAHPAGLAVVGNTALRRVSDLATDKAVRVLRSVARHAATPPVLQEMARTGVVAALCLVARSDHADKRTRERARDTLRLHATPWTNSPCLRPHIQAIYASIMHLD